jgi:hypothetical protein
MVVYAVAFPLIATDGRGSPVVSRLKQCGLSLAMYAGDFDDRLPLADTWMDAAYPYSKSNEIYKDPTVHDSKPDDYGYAHFLPLSGRDVAKLAEPEAVPLLFQSTLLVRNATGGLDTLPNPPRVQPRSGVQKNHVAFLDTHVEAFSSSWPYGPTVVKFR